MKNGSHRWLRSMKSHTEIVVRSFSSVGGTRPGRKYARRAEARARRKGFASAAQMRSFFADKGFEA